MARMEAEAVRRKTPFVSVRSFSDHRSSRVLTDLCFCGTERSSTDAKRLRMTNDVGSETRSLGHVRDIHFDEFSDDENISDRLVLL